MASHSDLPDSDDVSLEELFQRPSSFPNIVASMRGFQTEEDAREVGNIVLGFLRLLGTHLDLERLEAVTLAYDYEDTIAHVDRGDFKRILKPTHDNFAVGVAVAVPVIRDRVPRMHLVLNAAFMFWLKNPSGPDFQIALHIIAHEAVHVHDLAFQDRAYPGLFGQPILDSRDALLFDIAQSCWEEYIASYLSASYAPASQTGNFESTFVKVLEGVRDRSNANIRQYRTHGDVTRLIAQFASEYGSLLKYAAYLLGHLRGLDQTLGDAAPRVTGLIGSQPWFSGLFDQFRENLDEMYKEYGKWSGVEVFDPLKHTVHEVFKAAGIEFQSRPGGKYYLDVPFTPQTMS